MPAKSNSIYAKAAKSVKKEKAPQRAQGSTSGKSKVKMKAGAELSQKV
jgi:hypothetical protein